MPELVPRGRGEGGAVLHWHPVAQFLGRLVGRGESLEEYEAARIAEVRADTARAPGAVGRLGRLANGLLLFPPEGASVSGNPYRMQIRRVVHPIKVEFSIAGNLVLLERNTDYNYDPIFGRTPPGYDEITVTVTHNDLAESLPGAVVMPPYSDLREIGMRVCPDFAPHEWLMHGRYQAGDWDGRPGSRYTWLPLGEAAANAFLDRVFGPEQSTQPELLR